MQNAKWIWKKGGQSPDTYADFRDTFIYNGGKASVKISADSNYALYINGKFVNSGQYPDFPHYKVYDELDITEFCSKGENRLDVTVWYYGDYNMSYYPGNAALKYCVYCGGDPVAISDEATLSRENPAYTQGERRVITNMVGFSFRYDLTKEEPSFAGFENSVSVEQNLPLYPRPIEKTVIKAKKDFDIVLNEENKHYIFDLKEETVGYLDFRLTSEAEQEIKIVYGEYLENGAVHYSFPNNRNFIVNCTLKKGDNTYFNPFRRFGLRYFEIFAEAPVTIEYFTVRPTEYPLKRKENKMTDPLRKRIFDVATRTLELCMHDHFEDCPWREQGLYGMDGRMAMRYSYYAFEDFNFVRSNLVLFSKAQVREDKLMPICIPSGDPLSIPTYALYFIIAVYEYFMQCEDESLLFEVADRVNFYLVPFIDRLDKCGLVQSWLKSENAWNFYDWAPGFTGYGSAWETKSFDGVLNCLLIMALRSAHKINTVVGTTDDYLSIAEKIRASMELLYDKEAGLYDISSADDRKSEFVNALAILSGVAKGDRAKYIAERLADKNSQLVSASFPMRAVKYDALILTDMAKYRDFILSEIDAVYKMMLDCGSTSFWETEEGAANCGSLCHAWAAIPTYYYTILEA